MQDETGQLFAVTTRSRLKGPWLFPSMMLATMKVRRQLEAGGDVVQWASIVAGPSEFWTITIWRSRHDMQEFMRSGAHDEVMWSFSKLLRSFWLMRWRPGPYEVGRWKGVTMGQSEPAYERAPMDAPQAEALQKALDHLPKLKAATAADGSVSYESTPYARRRREEVGGAGGAVIHIGTSPRHMLEAVMALRTLRRQASRDPDFLRAVVGMGRPGEFYMLGLWADRSGAARLLHSAQCKELERKWPDGFWANEWIPENEFGHWDGVRLRRARQRYAIPVPKAAMVAAE
ncbi:MAG TPA: hypothetical protein VMZ51_02950 [Acidimicrobiales bacterium]|nr:hypothetical protein [Acidimicrobiales bacterium]